MATEVGVGLRAGEMVLRGGCLPSPVVLTNLREVGGRSFYPLQKSCKNLYAFLTHRPMRSKALGITPIFDEIAAKLKEARTTAMQDEPVADEAAQDLVAALDLIPPDVPPTVSIEVPSRTKRRHCAKARRVMVSFGSITLERLGVVP